MTTRLVAALPEIRRVLLASAPHAAWIHGDMHPGNVILRRGAAGAEPVLLDWARARPGSPLEDVSAWVQSLGHWEPQARRFHDTLVRAYLAARGLEPRLDRQFRRLYWLAVACNALAGALRYHVDTLGQARTPAQRATALTLTRKWLRVIRRADASWRAA
jgi:Ser/Thr protein kinase RdoA (MazF antagonist)